MPVIANLGGMMGALIRVRWQVLVFECELLMGTEGGQLCLSKNGVVLSRTSVTSAAAAYAWAATEAARVTSALMQQPTGTD